MQWIPKFRYPHTSGTVLTLTRPQSLWAFDNEPIGGHERAAVQTVAASFTIARLRTLDLSIRFTEQEYDNVEALIEWMQDNANTAVDLWLDKDEALTATVLLVAPVHGQKWRPDRNPDYPSDFSTTLTVMKSSGASWGALPYFDV